MEAIDDCNIWCKINLDPKAIRLRASMRGHRLQIRGTTTVSKSRSMSVESIVGIEAGLYDMSLLINVKAASLLIDQNFS